MKKKTKAEAGIGWCSGWISMDSWLEMALWLALLFSILSFSSDPVIWVICQKKTLGHFEMKKEEEDESNEVIKYDPKQTDQRLHPDKGTWFLNWLRNPINGSLEGSRNQWKTQRDSQRPWNPNQWRPHEVNSAPLSSPFIPCPPSNETMDVGI